MTAPERDPDIDELAALLSLDALTSEEQADAEMQLGPFDPQLAAVTAALAEAVAADPPPDLGPAVLEAALARRPAGAPVQQEAPADPVAGLLATIDDLRALLDDLSPAEAQTFVADRFGRVHDVVSHLVGIEELALEWTGAVPPRPEGELPEHLQATSARVAELADTPFADVVDLWFTTARRAAEACRAADPELVVQAHDLPSSIGGLILLRTFELWTHALDIAAATGRPRPELDTPRLLLMSRRLLEALPVGIALRGHTPPDATVRLVLTGPAGGTYDLSLLGTPVEGEPAATIVADVVDLCLLATQRLGADDIDVVVEGDAQLVPLVLSGAGAFARD